MNTDIIIDSSVALKWFFPEEESSNESLKIKKDFTEKKIMISIPVLFFYEVGNVLKSSVKSLRIDSGKAKTVYEKFTHAEFITYSSKELFKDAFEKADSLDITFYDASYVVLADYLKIPFYTADKKLLQKIKGEYVFHLKEYPLK
ncbi:MAG: type II toxin-antitoxin system VapC family toxin [Patescibacteria group bacterium]